MYRSNTVIVAIISALFDARKRDGTSARASANVRADLVMVFSKPSRKTRRAADPVRGDADSGVGKKDMVDADEMVRLSPGQTVEAGVLVVELLSAANAGFLYEDRSAA